MFQQVSGSDSDAIIPQQPIFKVCIREWTRRFSHHFRKEFRGPGNRSDGVEGRNIRFQRPKLRDIPVDGPTDAGRPGNTGALQARFSHGIPESGYTDGRGVPIPASGLSFRLKGRVVEDAMSSGDRTGDHGGMGRIGHGGKDPSYCTGLSSLLSHLLNHGGRPGRVLIEVGSKAVDGYEDNVIRMPAMGTCQRKHQAEEYRCNPGDRGQVFEISPSHEPPPDINPGKGVLTTSESLVYRCPS